jgi:hypothetical protein
MVEAEGGGWSLEFGSKSQRVDLVRDHGGVESAGKMILARGDPRRNEVASQHDTHHQCRLRASWSHTVAPNSYPANPNC